MADVYEIITDRIIRQLEAGTIPWHKPWKAGPHGWPKNLVSKKTYRGVNVFLLSCTQYELPYWVTFKQAKDCGGHVRKGEKSTPVVFWKWYEKDRNDPETGQEQRDRIPILRYYSVFNVAQCEGLEKRIPDVSTGPAQPFAPIEACESIVAEMPSRPAITHGSTGAFYHPASDTVSMPSRERFDNPEAYYSTVFHELTHSTGHQSRLNRPTLNELARFGDANYSKEELVAEMGAAFLCGQAGIENATIDASASYVAGWLRRLRDDRRLVVLAAANAQKAADFILGRTWDDEGESES